MIYKAKLKSIRENASISQKELANFLNISPYTLSHYENEQDIMPSKYLDKLTEYFDISIDYLFDLTEIIKYENKNKEIDKLLSGQRLKEFRKENKLTQVKLASLLNTVHSVIVKWENGTNLIATPFLYTICKKYNISADYLLGLTDSPKYLKTSNK